MNNITFFVRDSKKIGWLALVSSGVEIELAVNVSVRTLITRELEIADDYLEERIRTVFLNGSPVDNIDTAIVRPGQQLTLCTAMPGAMGICMRRDSPLKAYRPGITHHENNKPLGVPEIGRITIKLFNFIAREQGPHLLELGVILSTKSLLAHLETRDTLFWADVVAISLDNEQLLPKELTTRLARLDKMRLTILTNC